MPCCVQLRFADLLSSPVFSLLCIPVKKEGLGANLFKSHFEKTFENGFPPSTLKKMLPCSSSWMLINTDPKFNFLCTENGFYSEVGDVYFQQEILRNYIYLHINRYKQCEQGKSK